MAIETQAVDYPTTVVGLTPAEQAARTARLDKLRRNHVLTAMGVGLVPIPIVDVIGVTGVGVDLIKKLSEEFGDRQYNREKVRSLLTALLAGLLPVAIGGAVISLLKVVPLIGSTAGAVAMPALFGGAIYAVHNVFVEHYENGGTILDFDPVRFKSRFKEEFTKGKVHAASVATSETKEAA